jgi:twitching motility two-component system response regulator PilG
MNAPQTSAAKQPGREFSVAVIGANKNDTDVLQNIFKITRYRQRSYTLVAVNELTSKNQWASARNADIFMVNASNARAVLCWHKLTNYRDSDRRKPVLQLREKTPQEQPASELIINCPINPTRLLQTLDNYTIRHLDYYPELEIGEDTDLRLLKPLMQSKSAIASDLPAPGIAANKQPESNKLRILVADDSLAVRRQLTLEFEAMNAELDAVIDGESAVSAAETRRYDLIFMDVVMPGMDGYTACKQIRRSAFNKNTPVVMLTSRSSRFDKLKGVLAGCDTYLTKPVNHNEFKAITQKHLEQRKEKRI